MEKTSVRYVGSLKGTSIKRVDFKLPEQTRTAIIKTLGKSDDDPEVGKFLAALDVALGSYLVIEEQAKEFQATSEQVRTWAKLMKQSNALLESFDKLDDFSIRMLKVVINGSKGIPDQIDPETGITNTDNQLEMAYNELKMISICFEALHLSSKKNNKRGTPPKINRQRMIASVIRAYQDSFGRLPSSTSGNDFEEVLRICLASVDCVIEEVHKEIVQSLKRIKGK